MKNWKPIIIKNSKIPVIMSKITSMNIDAVSFACFMFCRSNNPSNRLIRHETIHYQQQLELLFIFQWLLYGLFSLIGLIKYRNLKKSYFKNLFEQEAYDNEGDTNYLSSRKRYSWWKYKT
jgi:hypothetical protein